MGGQITRKDYLTSGLQHVDTGAERGLFTIKSPEKRMIENQQTQNQLLGQQLAAQALQLKATGHTYQAIQAQGAALDQGLNQGFGQVNADIQNVGAGLAQGMSQGFGQVSADIQNVGAGLAQGMNQGFGQVSADIQNVGAGLAQGMSQGFGRLATGLSRIDTQLVSGFQGLATQNQALSAQVGEIGRAISQQLSAQGELTRQSINQLERQLCATLEREGQLTREAITRAALSSIEALRREGELTRGALGQLEGALSTALNKLGAQLNRNLSRQEELRSREHTKAALRYLNAQLYGEARAALDQALSAYSGYFPARYLSGVVSVLLGELSAGVEHLRGAVAIAGLASPRQGPREAALAQLTLGRTLSLLGRWAEAERALGSFDQGDPYFLIATIEQAFAIWWNPQRGTQEERSELIARGFLSLSIHDASLAWYGLALLLTQGDPESAASACLKALECHELAIGRPPTSLEVEALMSSLYPDLIPALYAAVLLHKPSVKGRLGL